MAASTAALRGITKQYKDFTLGPVDMTVPAGSIVGLIGENGAGKTTLLKILCGVNRADDGTVDLLGGSPADAATRAKIGVVFEDAFFYGSFNAAQVARSLAGMYGARWNADSFSAYLRRFGLDAGKKLKEYSRGMRLNLSLAAALAHDPELLVLDEATAGLDPVVRGELLDLFLEFIQDERHSIVMSSHITADLEQIADSIAYLHNGQLLFQENKDDLLQEYGVLHCGEDVLPSLPAGLVVFTRRGAYGCESLVRERRTVQELLPEAVCDAARLPELLVLDEATAGLDPVVRGELLDLFLEFIQDERHSIVMSSHITADLEQIADSIAYLHNGQLLFQENKDDLLQEYGVLHCGEDVLPSLPAGLVVFTRRGAYGCESLVRERRTVQELLPEAVCDAARLDDIMRFYSGRDAQ